MTGKLSKSTLSLVEECPACFWYHINGIRRESTISSGLPNLVESFVLNRFLPYRAKKGLPPELDIPELKGYYLIDEETHKKWKNVFSGEPCFEDLTANPDEALTNGENFIIVDIKTASKKIENCSRGMLEKDIENYNYKFQLELYTYILNKSGRKTTDKGYILFYLMKDEGNNKISLKPELFKLNLKFDKVEKIYKKAKEIMKMTSPPDVKCNFCSSHKERYEKLLKEGKEQEVAMKEIMKLNKI